MYISSLNPLRIWRKYIFSPKLRKYYKKEKKKPKKEKNPIPNYYAYILDVNFFYVSYLDMQWITSRKMFLYMDIVLVRLYSLLKKGYWIS